MKRALLFASGLLALTAATAACNALREDLPAPSDGGIDGAFADTGTDSGIDAPADAGADAVDALADSGEGAAPIADFYVDRDAGPPAFTSITAALAAANASTAAVRTIHVAKGVYGPETGETFPLEIRGINLVGASRASTVLRGASVASVGAPAISPTDPVRVALLVGDFSKTTTLAHLTVAAAESTAVAGTEGIVCNRGNVAGPGSTTPNTILDDVALDNFDIGLRVSSDATSGCSALVRASTIENDAFGVLAEGATVPVQYVSVHLGDGNDGGGNAFRGLKLDAQRQTGLSYFNGSGLVVRGAATGGVVVGNQFSDSDVGIDMFPQHGTDRDNGWIIEKNDFGPLRNLGMNIVGDSTIERLTNNSFHDIATPADIGFGGVGLAMTATSDAYPVIRLARGNSFFGNDTGLRIHGITGTIFSTDPKLMSDFGHAGDDGLNTLRCNAMGAKSVSLPEVGVDFDIAASTPAQSFALAFEGNVWDHIPPTRAVADPVEGNDIYSKNVDVDVANAKTSATPCPSGRVAGPP